MSSTPGQNKPSKSRSGPSQSANWSNGSYPSAFDRLINELGALPGIGRRSAERIAFYLLTSSSGSASELARAITDMKQQVRHCEVCYMLCDGTMCSTCSDPKRDRSTVLVVEQPKDALAMERTGMYRGIYHVLLGRLSPLDGIGPGDLTITKLLKRVDDAAANAGGEAVQEVILGLNPTLEGDGTALYVAQELAKRKVRVSRLARGLPAGAQLEMTGKAVLADAIEQRTPMS